MYFADFKILRTVCQDERKGTINVTAQEALGKFQCSILFS